MKKKVNEYVGRYLVHSTNNDFIFSTSEQCMYLEEYKSLNITTDQ